MILYILIALAICFIIYSIKLNQYFIDKGKNSRVLNIQKSLEDNISLENQLNQLQHAICELTKEIESLKQVKNNEYMGNNNISSIKQDSDKDIYKYMDNIKFNLNRIPEMVDANKNEKILSNLQNRYVKIANNYFWVNQEEDEYSYQTDEDFSEEDLIGYN